MCHMCPKHSRLTLLSPIQASGNPEASSLAQLHSEGIFFAISLSLLRDRPDRKPGIFVTLKYHTREIPLLAFVSISSGVIVNNEYLHSPLFPLGLWIYIIVLLSGVQD